VKNSIHALKLLEDEGTFRAWIFWWNLFLKLLCQSASWSSQFPPAMNITFLWTYQFCYVAIFTMKSASPQTTKMNVAMQSSHFFVYQSLLKWDQIYIKDIVITYWNMFKVTRKICPYATAYLNWNLNTSCSIPLMERTIKTLWYKRAHSGRIPFFFFFW
jgi:hypothetical protein